MERNVGDTWSLALAGAGVWSRLTGSLGASVPAARWECSTIYDPVRDRMILFAGMSGGFFAVTHHLANVDDDFGEGDSEALLVLDFCAHCQPQSSDECKETGVVRREKSVLERRDTGWQFFHGRLGEGRASPVAPEDRLDWRQIGRAGWWSRPAQSCSLNLPVYGRIAIKENFSKSPFRARTCSTICAI